MLQLWLDVPPLTLGRAALVDPVTSFSVGRSRFNLEALTTAGAAAVMFGGWEAHNCYSGHQL